MRPSSSYSLRCTTISFSEKHRTSCRRCNAAQSDDFFRKLPYEVIILIFKNVHFPDIVECLNVSNSWNKSLSGCFELWRDMTISDSCHAFAIQPWIPDIHCHVQELTFSFADATTLSRTLGFIAAGYFEQLRSLQIYKCSATDLNPLVSALGRIGPNLRTLLVEFTAELIPIEQLLRDCPNLTELCYYTPLSANGSTIGSMDIPTNSHLQHLQFHVSNLRREQLEHVLRAIPNVRYLSIQTCEANGLAVVNQYCRRLEFISYNAGPYLIPWMKLLGREERTTIGLSRDHRSSGRFGTKTAETLASEFLDVFPEGVPKWAPMSTCGIHHFRGFRRGYDLDSYPKILATVFRDDTSNIINISARFLSMRQADRATPLDILAY